jgi:hypothetical protein
MEYMMTHMNEVFGWGLIVCLIFAIACFCLLAYGFKKGW